MNDFAEHQAVLELRRYTVVPGRRDELVTLFEREFVESQENTGAHLFGQFREPAEPGRFVWVRGFESMAARLKALTAFYYGPVWKQHGPAANDTMVDASDVVLLKPSGPGFPAPAAARPPAGEGRRPSSRVIVTVCHPTGPVAEFAEYFHRVASPLLTSAQGHPLACFETERAENTFPRLPVREDETVFVWFTFFATAGQLTAHERALAESAHWRDEVQPELTARLKQPWQRLVLEPTPRSHLR
ncbi:NIPSNAP family protein [Amycolatopsis sp. H20-H5]|uniref:NIPSNAP family protein n=1 Tax=Amycolatopsis sp. H20-H5 TaxID=3046309 RepID=UPI002DBA397B|nr:NIPSNAP family protein [Amycolatopsis sp. H20-H5]MEC3981759.1 NIPSNAP family protein [Amycolatopsis sp. H20-H5]